MRTLGVVLIASGLAVGVPALVVLHVLPTGLSPVRAPVSQYGITRYRRGYRVQTVAYGIAGLGAAIGIAAQPGPSSVVVGLCALFALTRATISWFPMDVPGTERSSTGRRHGVLAGSAFGAVGIAAAQLSRMLDGDHLHRVIATLSGILAAAMLAAFLAMGVDRRSASGHFGFIERAFYVLMTAWFVVVAVLVTLPL